MALAPFTPEIAERRQRRAETAAEAGVLSERRRNRPALGGAAMEARAPLPPSLLAGLVLLVDALAFGISAASVLAATQSLGAAVATPAVPLVLAAALTLVFGAWRGAYGRRALRAAPEHLSAILPAAAAGWAVSVLADTIGGWEALWPPAWVAACALASLGALSAGRTAVAAILRGPAGERFAPRALIVGGGSGILPLADHIRARSGDRLRLLGAVSEDADEIDTLRQAGIPCSDRLEAALVALRSGQVEQIILPARWALTRSGASVLVRLADFPVEVRLIAELRERDGDTHSRIGGLRLQERPVAGWRAAVKSAVDYSVALVALTIASVPMLLIALAIRLESPGPVLFRQRRTGLNDRHFRILKFRTMHHHAADPDTRRQVMARDDRVTAVGAVLRRTSLDELPQLFNILAGEMSFVGPRPHAPGTRAGGRRFDEITVRYAARHRVKPGLTGLAQVRGWRGPTDTEEKFLRRLECDLEYIERWSLSLDFVIMVRTLVAVAGMKNAL